MLICIVYIYTRNVLTCKYIIFYSSLVLRGLQTHIRKYITVTAQSNVNIEELNNFMLARGVALPSGPLINNPTLAGLTATCAHVREQK